MIPLETIWQDFLAIVKEEVGIQVVQTWLKTLSLHQYDIPTQTVVLQAPNSFVQDHVKHHYSTLIKTHLTRLLNISAVNIIITNKEHQISSSEPTIKPALIPNKPSIKSYGVARHSLINTNYLFETFVVGPHNQFAHNAAQAVANSLGTLYNPFIIYGKSGLGKTHLLHAIGNCVSKQYQRATILYQHAEQMVNEFNMARKYDRLHKFLSKYEKIDLLLLDDIQGIANTACGQEAFFSIFNTLYEAKRQIVLSSDTYPKDIKGLADRLRSRLQSGLLADIQLPDTSTLQAIIQKKAALQKLDLPYEVIQLLIQRTQNIRELEGALIRLAAFASMTKQPITLSLAHHLLQQSDQTYMRQTAPLPFDAIAQQVTIFYNVSLHDLRSHHRTKNISLARHICMYLMKKYTNKTLQEIGNFLYRTDHTTVMHAVQKIQQTRLLDPSFEQEIAMLEQKISPHISWPMAVPMPQPSTPFPL